MKIVVLASYAKSLIRFRRELLIEFAERGYEVIACAPEDDNETSARLKEMGINYRTIPLERAGMNPYRDLCSCFRIAAMLREIRPEIVLGYTIKPVIYGSLAARIAGVSRIYSMMTGLGYAFIGKGYKQWLTNQLSRILYRLALGLNKSVFFQNQDDRALFVGLGLVRDERTVILNGSGVDLEYFGESAPVAAPPSFLLIARLLRDKGIMEYAEAARILKQRYPLAMFRLLGPFDVNPSAIDPTAVKQWQESGFMEYLGETEDVRPFIASTGVYVLPSYREGTPRSVLEAMSMGRPIITTNVPGCRETVIDGENGFLVRERDSEGLARVMERFIQEPQLIESMGKKSRAMAESKFDVHKVNAVIIKTMGLDNEKDV
ncbi:MAG: glycosyltransferase family 4 protein [Geobacteraceae bacterium]